MNNQILWTLTYINETKIFEIELIYKAFTRDIWTIYTAQIETNKTFIVMLYLWSEVFISVRLNRFLTSLQTARANLNTSHIAREHCTLHAHTAQARSHQCNQHVLAKKYISS